MAEGITVKEYKRCVVVKMMGRVDTYTAPKLQAALQKIVDANHFKIVFDMSDIDFLSSKGWWVLINTHKTCKRYNRGKVILVGANDHIRNSMDLVGMKGYFDLFDNVTDAVGTF